MPRKSVGLFSPSGIRTLDEAGDDSDGGLLNDDEAERLRRRQDKVWQLNQKSSPLRNSDRRQTIQHNNNTLTNSQIAEQYTLCLKLSNENKITTKNAFTLQLIDLMQSLIVKKDGSEMTNFQMASCTLDASTKIYACRVDCIHAETFRMMSGLTRTGQGKGQKREKDDDSDNGEEGANTNKKQKKKKLKGSTIEQNLKNLSMNKVDLKFEVDPLFQKTSELFTDGGASGGILLNFLNCRDDSTALILDSKTILKRPSINSSKSRNVKLNLNEFKPLYKDLKQDIPTICPIFSSFEFGSWIPGENNALNFDIDISHHTVMDVNVSENVNKNGDSRDIFENHEDNYGVENMDDNEDEVQVPSHGSTSETSDNKSEEAILVQGLASEPNEYSYFNEEFLSAWAGPKHWRVCPRFNGKATGDSTKPPKKWTKKPPFRINYDAEVNFAKYFRSPKSEIQLAASTLKNRTDEATTLPEDLHYKSVKLIELFLKPTVLHCRKIREPLNSPDCSVTDYDYNNANDVENFIPAPQDGNPGEALSPYTPCFPETAADFTLAQNTSGEADGNTQSILPFAGDNLVQQPPKVAKFDIPVARSAKQINVKRLKASMWKLLVKKETETPLKSNTDDSKVEGQKSFNEVYDGIPALVNPQMIKDLSKPIAFVCLLHLVNEKHLELVAGNDIKDFKICQGKPPSTETAMAGD